jgi:integrase/recombinase XerD
VKINRHDQAKILSPQEIAWLFDGKVGLVSDLKLLRRLVLNGKGMEAIASLSLLSHIEGLPTNRDRALFGICLYTTARVNEACSLHTADVYGADGRVRDRITFRRATTKGKQETRSVPVSPELRQLLEGYWPKGSEDTVGEFTREKSRRTVSHKMRVKVHG